MKKLFTSRRLVVGVLILIITIGVITLSSRSRNTRQQPALPVRVVADVSGWVSQVVTVPVKAVTNGIQGTGKLLNTYQENERLNRKVDSLAATQVELQTVRAENKSLKKQLATSKTLTDYQKVNASVISRSPSNWQSELIINRGSNAGIRKNMSVMGPGGLIGRIAEVDTTSAKVELLSDNSQTANRFAIRVQAAGGKSVDGIITNFDQAQNMIVMGRITASTKVEPGDKVATSGLGGITPAGLYIGEVDHVSAGDAGLTKTIYIKPATDYNNISVVTVAIPET